ncbi:MAG TPA: MgtC/SapB family protein [Acidimicrobiia bacterium]|nr:MgtC/SapB family protein [Acidimicrobiia bacterium]
MSEWDMAARVALGFGLTYLIGFEREIRGGQAGDRTYSLIGTAAAAISGVAIANNAGNAIAGMITGVGFVGGALLFRGHTGVVRGITSASAVLAAAVIGAVAGADYPILAVVTAALVLLALELRYIPVLQYLDSRRYVGRYAGDDDPPPPRRSSPGAGPPTA